jgi:hypothetical protein
MRSLILAALVAVLPMVAVAQEDRLAGQWVSDVTGEAITIAPKSGSEMVVTFAKTGVASLTPVEQNGLKMTFSTGIFSSTECIYTVIRPGRAGDRMVWSAKPGSAETCPRGAFSRFGESSVVTTKVDSGRTIGSAQPPVRPAEVARENNYVRSAEQVVGRWAARDRTELRVEKSIGGWVIWAEQEGQGSFVVGEDGAIQANFSNSGTRCALNGRLYEGNFILQPEGRVPSTCPQGTFTRVSR